MTDGAGEGQGNSPRVLVAEDEIIVAIFIEDMLAEFGYRLAGVVSRLEEAMAHPANYDLAVLDVHLNGQPVFEFADQLAANGTPFVFATGYGARGIPPRFQDRPILAKPFVPDDLKRALEQIA